MFVYNERIILWTWVSWTNLKSWKLVSTSPKAESLLPFVQEIFLSFLFVLLLFLLKPLTFFLQPFALLFLSLLLRLLALSLLLLSACLLLLFLRLLLKRINGLRITIIYLPWLQHILIKVVSSLHDSCMWPYHCYCVHHTWNGLPNSLI